MKHHVGLVKDWIVASKISRKELKGLPFPALWALFRTFRHEKITGINGQYVINTFLPPFPSEAYKRLCETTLSVYHKEARPFSAYLALTNKCGFNCWHCSKDKRVQQQELDTQQWITIVKQLQNKGMAIIGFTGGEPLYRDDLEEIAGAVDQRSTVALFTSGEGLTFKRAQALRKSGVFYASLSLDHYEKKGHNALRGRDDAFDIALDAIKVSLETGFYTAIQLSANKNFVNEKDLKSYVDFAGKLGVHEIRITEPMPTGRLLGAQEDIFLSNAQRQLLKKLHISVNKNRHEPKVAAFAYVEDKLLYGCGAGIQHLYVDAFGNLCPCDFTPLSFGNLVSDGFDVSYQRLRDNFKRPSGECFVLANKDLIAAQVKGALPLTVEDSVSICRECKKGRLPKFYLHLGWNDNG